MTPDTCTYRPLPHDIPSDVITDLEFLEAIEAVLATGQHWATGWDLSNALGVPGSLIRRKARRTYRRGLTWGCICGCRGDFTITPKGLALLDVSRGVE